MAETFAVIATGGKQLLVRPGDTVHIEKLPGDPTSPVTFSEVLLVVSGENVQVGKPTVAGASVTGTILAQGRHQKVVGVKFKPKKRYRRKFGHRQRFTEVRIESIQS